MARARSSLPPSILAGILTAITTTTCSTHPAREPQPVVAEIPPVTAPAPTQPTKNPPTSPTPPSSEACAADEVRTRGGCRPKADRRNIDECNRLISEVNRAQPTWAAIWDDDPTKLRELAQHLTSSKGNVAMTEVDIVRLEESRDAYAVALQKIVETARAKAEAIDSADNAKVEEQTAALQEHRKSKDAVLADIAKFCSAI
jgi:hypothetical protein